MISELYDTSYSPDTGNQIVQLSLRILNKPSAILYPTYAGTTSLATFFTNLLTLLVR